MNTLNTPSVTRVLAEMNLESLDQAYQYCLEHDVDPKALVMDTQPIAFDSATEAYTLGTALALHRRAKPQNKQPTLSVKHSKPLPRPVVSQSSAKSVLVTEH